MKFEVEELSSVKKRLSIEVPVERVRDEFNRVLGVYSQQVRVKGFRKGKVPRSVVEKYFGSEVRNEVTQTLVQEGFSGALEENDLEIVAQPELDIGDPKPDEPLKFSATVEIRPTIEQVSTDGLAAARERVSISDEQVDKFVEGLRMQQAQLVPVEDRPQLASGDFATIKMEVTDDAGEPVPQLFVESGTVEVGGEHLPKEVDGQLALARVGETFSVEDEAPPGAPEELQNKKLKYTITVEKVSERVLPDLDDEFAKDHGDCETLGDLRERISTNLEERERRRVDGAVREALIGQLIEKNPIDVPPSMVSSRIEDLLRDFKNELAGQGLQLTSAQHEEEAREKLRERAERDVHAQLLLERLSGQLDVEVGDDEVAEQIAAIVQSAGQHGDAIREHYEHGHARDAVRSEMKRSRTLEQLVGIADVTEVDPPADPASE